MKPPKNNIKSDLDNFFTRKDILNYFKIGISTYRRWRVRGYLVGIQKGWAYLYPKKEIEALVKRLEQEFTK